MSPISRPPTTTCRIMVDVKSGLRSSSFPYVPNRFLGRDIERIDRVVPAVPDLLDHRCRSGVLSGAVEPDALPRHDRLVARNVGRHQRLAQLLGIGRAGAVDRI